MAVIVKVGYNCGCGYLTNKSKEAITHCRETGHTITVAGLISNPTKKAEIERRKECRIEELSQSQ